MLPAQIAEVTAHTDIVFADCVQQRNPSPSLSDERDNSLSDIVLQNELKVWKPSACSFRLSIIIISETHWHYFCSHVQVEQLTKDWSESWRDKRALLEQYSVDINQDRAGVQIQSLRPHLISLEPDVLSTGVTIYHLRVLTLLVLSFSSVQALEIGPV